MVGGAVAARRAATTEAGRWIFALALGVYFFTAGGSLTTSDAVVTFDVTRSIVERGSFEIPRDVLGLDSIRAADGRVYSPFGILQSVYNIPYYVAGTLFVRTTGITAGRADSIPKAAVALGQVVLGAAIVWLIFRLSLVVTGDESASALAALTGAFGTVLWPYSTFGFNQPLACVTLLAAVHAVVIGVRLGRTGRIVVGGFWLAASLLTRHEMALAAVPIGLWLLATGTTFRARLGRLAALLPGVLAGVAVWLWYNAVRFGNPLDSGYLRDTTPAIGSPLMDGLAGLLFSPGASVFVYSPVATLGVAGLVWLWRRDRRTTMLFIGIVLVFVVFYASLGNWMAGRSWGSRYLLVVLPYVLVGWAALLARMGRGWRVLAMVLATAVGAAVQLPGVVVDYAKVSQSSATHLTPVERQWQWAASPLALNTRATIEMVPANVAYVAGWRRPPAVARTAGASDRGFSQQFAFSLDFWWLYLFYLGLLPRMAVVAAIAAFAIWVGWSARGVGRELA